MKTTFFIVFTIIISVMAYSGTTDTTYNTISQEKLKWFEDGEWHSRISAQPDASIDIEALYDTLCQVLKSLGAGLQLSRRD
jgi:hypothetical protein